MNADGTGTRQLTSGKDERLASDVVGETERDIAFERASDIYVMDADGSNPRRISDPPPRSQAGLVAGRAVDRIRPSDARHRRTRALVDACRRLRPPRADPQNASVVTPAWSPDSARIVFATQQGRRRLRAVHGRPRRQGAAKRRADGVRQLRAVVVARRVEDRVLRGRRDLHGRARRRRGREAHRQREQRLVARLESAAAARRRVALRRFRSARTPRAAACRRGRRRGSRSRSRPSASASTSTSSAIACGTTTTPSSSPDDPVSGLDPHAADRDRNLGRLELPAPRRVLGRDEAGEDREALVADEVRRRGSRRRGRSRRRRAPSATSRTARRDARTRPGRRRTRRRSPPGTSPSIASTLRIALSYDVESGFVAGPPFTV